VPACNQDGGFRGLAIHNLISGHKLLKSPRVQSRCFEADGASRLRARPVVPIRIPDGEVFGFLRVVA
jgi:hypothetical protein